MHQLQCRIQKTLQVHRPCKAHLRIVQVQIGADEASTTYGGAFTVSALFQGTFPAD